MCVAKADGRVESLVLDRVVLLWIEERYFLDDINDLFPKLDLSFHCILLVAKL